jgi:Icc-related predicted phosphoesterase
MGFLKRRGQISANRLAGTRLRLYYASDVHGSDICWRKFLGARGFYDAPVLIMGGDLTGKAVVPIETNGGEDFRARFMGETRSGSGKNELQELIDAIRYNGLYPWVARAEEIARMRDDDAARADLLHQVMADDLRRWVAIADQRLESADTSVFVIPGNDDPWFVDDILASSRSLRFCDDCVVQVGPYEMLSLSYANPTPWDSPRELDEHALYERIKGLADQLDRPRTAIFNLHVPPHNSGLDRAIQVDPGTLTHVYKSGMPVEVPVGSTAVRQIIEEYQPLLSLHGHVHESRGEAQIGRTRAVNPGSEYNGSPRGSGRRSGDDDRPVPWQRGAVVHHRGRTVRQRRQRVPRRQRGRHRRPGHPGRRPHELPRRRRVTALGRVFELVRQLR